MAYIQGSFREVDSSRAPACVVKLPSLTHDSFSHPPLPLSLVCGSVLQQVCTVELFFVSHPGLGGKYREECCRGTRGGGGGGEQQRQRGGVHSSGILLGWSIFAARSVSAVDVNTVSDPEFQQRLPLSPVPTVLPTGTKPQWKRYGGQHLETLIYGYFCKRR